LRQSGAKEAYDTLAVCKSLLIDRITESTKHALRGEKLLAEHLAKSNSTYALDLSKKQKEALQELVTAYRIYPRNAPVLIALIQWFASHRRLSDTQAPEKLLELIKKWQGDDECEIDYVAKATELLSALREIYRPRKSYGFSKEEKRQLFWKDLFHENAKRSVMCSDPTPINEGIDEGNVRASLKRPHHLSFRIDEKFFNALREEVSSRLASTFGGTAEYGDLAREETIWAINEAEAVLYPAKRAAVEKHKAEKTREAEKAAKERQETMAALLASVTKKPSADTHSFSAPAYGSESYGSEPDYTLYPYSAQYPYSYDNPYSSVTDTARWAHAEAIGIEWDIIDRDYYLDLGIFGDHSL
jgi:hypothetical protein